MNENLGITIFVVQTMNGGFSSVAAVRDSYEDAVEACKVVARGCVEYWEASANRSGCTDYYVQVTTMHTSADVWAGRSSVLFTALLERRGKSINLSVEGVVTPLSWMNTPKEGLN